MKHAEGNALQGMVGIDVLFFDVGGVLLAQDAGVFDEFDRKHGLDTGTTHREWGEWLRVAHTGSVHLPGEFSSFPLLSEFRTKLYATNNSMPGILEVLDRVSQSHRLGVISNFTCDLDKVLEQIGVLKYFDHIINSSIEGVAKPSSQIYEIACARFNVLPIRAVLIDDNVGNVEAARRFGMHGIVCSSTESLLGNLRAIGIPMTVSGQ